MIAFDDEIAVLQVLVTRRAGSSRASGPALPRDLALLDAVVEELLGCGRVPCRGTPARPRARSSCSPLRAHLRDAGAHEAATRDTPTVLIVHLRRVSTMAAMPWPPPIHAVARPRFNPRRRSSRVSDSRMRVPVMPSGCPSAMAPPLTLTLSRSRPSSFSTARYCAANASLTSTRSMSSSVSPAFFEHERGSPAPGPSP